MKILDILLEKFWILKDEDRELYYQIRDSLKDIKPFINEKLGYQVIVTPQLIKLEKLPGAVESWMGIENFSDTVEYAILCLILMFLESKGKEEQFLLSELTEFLEGTFPGEEKLDWTLYRHRKHLINVLKFTIAMGMIKTNDGDEQSFANSIDAEVLYENTGASMYFMRNFTGNILNYNTIDDLENDEWIDIDKDRGRIRRNRVYRRIIMSPAVYNGGTQDQDYAYIKNYRNMIQTDVENYMESEFHVHKNGAFLILNEDKNYRDAFPSNRAISDIVLQMNKLIVEKIQEKELNPLADDVVVIPKYAFDTIVGQLRQENIAGWSKEYREMKVEKLRDEIMEYMLSYSMLEFNAISNEVKIMPAVGKIIGRYPKDFKNTYEEGEDK